MMADSPIIHEPSGEAPYFVYGSLLEGFHNEAEFLAPYVKVRHQARITGGVMWHLVRLGYPILVPSDPERVVHGELVWLTDFAAATPGLDFLEGYEGPEAENDYVRRLTLATDTETGESVQAYTYWSAKTILEVEEPAIPVTGGDWRTFMERTKFAAGTDILGESDETE